MNSKYPSNNQRKNAHWKLESYPSDFSKCDLTGSEGVSWLEYIKVKKGWTGLQRGNVFNCGSGARRASCRRDFWPRNQDSSKTSKPRWTAGWSRGELVSLPTTTVGHSAKWPEFKHSSSLPVRCVRFCRHWSAYWSCKLVAPESILGHWVTDWVEDISLYRQRPISGNKFEGSFDC